MSERHALDSYIETLQILAREGDADRTDAERERDATHRTKLIDAFAHELAERQRASGRDDYCAGTDCCGQHGGVADLIDPPGHGAGPVRPDEEPTT